MKNFIQLACCVALAFAPSVFAAGLEQAKVTKIVNQVEVIPSGDQPEPAQLGEVISGHTGVRTGGNSRAQLTFSDNTLARLGANTLFSFQRGTRSLDLENGTILLQVPKDAGGATIHSAPVTAAITGTTLMMEYSPGNPGTVKLIVLEGTVRLSLKGRLGESVLLNPGEMLTVAANAKSLPNPVPVDVKRILRTSRLVKEGELESMGLIMETVDNQQQMIADKRLTDGGPVTPENMLNNPALIANDALNNQNLRRDTVPLSTPVPTPIPMPTAIPHPTGTPYTPPAYSTLP